MIGHTHGSFTAAILREQIRIVLSSHWIVSESYLPQPEHISWTSKKFDLEPTIRSDLVFRLLQRPRTRGPEAAIATPRHGHSFNGYITHRFSRCTVRMPGRFIGTQCMRTEMQSSRTPLSKIAKRSELHRSECYHQERSGVAPVADSEAHAC